MNQTMIDTGRFDVAKIAATLPETTATLLVDHYLTNREAASARVFRICVAAGPSGLRSIPFDARPCSEALAAVFFRDEIT